MAKTNYEYVAVAKLGDFIIETYRDEKRCSDKYNEKFHSEFFSVFLFFEHELYSSENWWLCWYPRRFLYTNSYRSIFSSSNSRICYQSREYDLRYAITHILLSLNQPTCGMLELWHQLWCDDIICKQTHFATMDSKVQLTGVQKMLSISTKIIRQDSFDVCECLSAWMPECRCWQ